MSKVIIATLKQDLTRAYALFEKVLDFSVLAGICLSIVCAYSRVVGDLLSTCLNGAVSQVASLYMDPLKLARDFDNFFIT